MTFRHLARITGAAVFALAVLLPIHVRAGKVPVIDVTNWIQNYAQYVEAYQQTTGQLEIIQHMTRNLMTHGSPQWGEVATLINRLQGALETGNSIAYSMADLATLFQQRFPGYEPVQDFPTRFESWSATTLDTLRGVLVSTSINVSDLPNVQAALDALRALNSASSGRLQALQVGNMIASHQVEELAKLRQLMAAATNAQTVYLASQEAKHAGAEASFSQFIFSGETDIPTRRPGEGFGRDAVPELTKPSLR